MAFTRLDDIVVHHASVGPPDAPALVFANSLGTDLRIWDDLLPAFADRWRLVRYDLRGHGLTDSTPGPYSIAGLAADLARLLDHLKVRDALVCGLSIGGMVAQALAASRPDLARALVLMDTAPKIGTPESWQQRIDGVILLSPRTAGVYVDLVHMHNLGTACRGIVHFCISQATTERLRPLDGVPIQVPLKPNLQEMLALIGPAAAN